MKTLRFISCGMAALSVFLLGVYCISFALPPRMKKHLAVVTVDRGDFALVIASNRFQHIILQSSSSDMQAQFSGNLLVRDATKNVVYRKNFDSSELLPVNWVDIRNKDQWVLTSERGVMIPLESRLSQGKYIATISLFKKDRAEIKVWICVFEHWSLL